MRRTWAGAVLAILLAAASVANAAPQIVNAWMRPTIAGAASADAYADVRTDVPLTLLDVRTVFARRVEIVVHDPRNPASVPRVVEKLDLVAGETRFALRGSVLRLIDIQAPVVNGVEVPFAFEFADANGERQVVEARVQVRGLGAPQPSAPAASTAPPR